MKVKLLFLFVFCREDSYLVQTLGNSIHIKATEAVPCAYGLCVQVIVN